ncbi:hypothetical protein ZIOFF_051445 [Zingiber officinale]|uniref:phosphoenolpyruvate carboxykinase (ATP) n=1 Tax=Zingiber officinale TaxID=94328 RepID=A0A8J5FSS4_ZINOF|nr:hypothetical protein ZIOFF_051445 [Zingiber officinale]
MHGREKSENGIRHDDNAPAVKAKTIDELHSLQKKRSAPTTPIKDGAQQGNAAFATISKEERQKLQLESISDSLASLTRETRPKVVRGDPARKAEATKVAAEHHHYLTPTINVSDSALKFTHVLYNLSPLELYEQAIKHEHGSFITSTGALATLSGTKTGHSPRDKRVVKDETTANELWWGKCIRPTPEELEDFSTLDFTIYNAGQFPCNRYTHYMTTSTSIDLNLDRKEMVILGTQYAGEMKKGLFGVMHYLMPKRNILSLHSSNNMGKDGDVALFFGLSGKEKENMSVPGLLSLADLCRRTDYPALCLDAAKAYGHAYPSPPDAAALLSMHLDMAADHTRTVKAEAEELLSKGKGSPREKGAIDVCNTQFGDAIDDTDTVREAVKGRDAGTANTVLSAIITYYDTCDDAFAEIPLPNPFAKQDDSLSKIISNALALVPIVIS